MKFDKALMYVTTREPTHWEIDNIERVMLTSNHPWDTYSIDDSLEGYVVLPRNIEVNKDLYD